MRKNKKKLLLASIVGLAVFGSILGSHLLKEEGTLLPPPTRDQTLAVYIEDENSETGYSKSESTKFPAEGYILNLEKSTCTNGGELSQDSSTKKISLSIAHKSSCSLYFDEEILEASDILAKKIANAKSSDNLNFAEPATTDETADGLYGMEDDYGTSYYYRGAVEDNYVKFAGFYWRIIRINGDGSLRMIYDGTQAHENGVNSTDRFALQNIPWNTKNQDDAKYVGYMYGGANGSISTSKSGAQRNETETNIKIQLENWYKTNIVDKGYDKYVSDNIFCNDRSTPGKEETGSSSDTGLGYGWNNTSYGALARLGVGYSNPNYNNPSPKFTCENKNDAFTKEDTEKGNGKLGEKVGLITADEIVAGGSGKYNTPNSNYYLYKGSRYYSLSPNHFQYALNDKYTYVFAVLNTGGLSSGSVSVEYISVAPVISLSADYLKTMSGKGTKTSPYNLGSDSFE